MIVKYDLQLKCMLVSCRHPLPSIHLIVPLSSIFFIRVLSSENILQACSSITFACNQISVFNSKYHCCWRDVHEFLASFYLCCWCGVFRQSRTDVRVFAGECRSWRDLLKNRIKRLTRLHWWKMSIRTTNSWQRTASLVCCLHNTVAVVICLSTWICLRCLAVVFTDYKPIS